MKTRVTVRADGDMIAGKWMNNGEAKKNMRMKMKLETLK